jgi:hypothetical protein
MNVAFHIQPLFCFFTPTFSGTAGLTGLCTLARGIELDDVIVSLARFLFHDDRGGLYTSDLSCIGAGSRSGNTEEAVLAASAAPAGDDADAEAEALLTNVSSEAVSGKGFV